MSGVVRSANRSLHTIVVTGPGGDVIKGNFLGTDPTGPSIPMAFYQMSNGIIIDHAPVTRSEE